MKYFKFYTTDFLIGTNHFTDQEVGIYIRMLCYQWDKGSLPKTDGELKSVFGGGITPKVMDKFIKTDCGLLNERLNDERSKAMDKVAKMSKNGKKGAEMKWSGGILIPLTDNDKKHIIFYIGITGFSETPAEWIIEFAMKYVESQLIKNKVDPSGDVLNRTLELLNSNYQGYQFKDSNHVKNSFRICLDKILNQKTTTKLSIDGSSSF